MEKHLEITFINEVEMSYVRGLAGGGSYLNSSNKCFGTKVGTNSIAVLSVRICLEFFTLACCIGQEPTIILTCFDWNIVRTA